MTSLNSIEEIHLAEKLVSMHSWADQARFTRSGGAAEALPRLCRGSVQALRRLCGGSAKALQRLCGGSAEALQRLCRDSAEALQRLCRGSAEALQKLCGASAELLRGLCGCSAGVVWRFSEYRFEPVCRPLPSSRVPKTNNQSNKENCEANFFKSLLLLFGQGCLAEGDLFFSGRVS